MDCFSRVEGIRLTTVVLRALTPLSHPYQLSVSGGGVWIQYSIYKTIKRAPQKKTSVRNSPK